MYRVEISSSARQSFHVKSKGHEFTIDSKGEEGITPPDVLLASLASCVGVYIRKYIEGAKLEISQFSVSAEADFSSEAPICFKKINVSVDLKGVKLDERRLKAMSEFIKKCPIHNTLKNDPEVDIKIS